MQFCTQGFWVQKETEEENRSMENKRDSEIDGCYSVEAFLFPSLTPISPVTNPQTSLLLSVKLQAGISGSKP